MNDKAFKIIVFSGIGILFAKTIFDDRVRRYNSRETERIVNLIGEDVIDNRTLIKGLINVSKNNNERITILENKSKNKKSKA